jgi:hypothetical protein
LPISPLWSEFRSVLLSPTRGTWGEW